MLEEAIAGTLSELGFHPSNPLLNLLAEKEPCEFRSMEGTSFGESGIQFSKFSNFDLILELQQKLGF